MTTRDDEGDAAMEAIDFRIEVGDRVGAGYRVKVTGPDDELTTVVGFDLDEPVLRAKLDFLPTTLVASSAPSRAVASAEEQHVQFIGSRLFRQLMAEETLGMLSAARRQARNSGRPLRLTLRIRPAELSGLPWEFLYDEREGRREYLGRQCLLVRDSEDLPPVPPLPVSGPLRMLAMVADASDLPRLRAAAERAALEAALAGLTGAGQIELCWVEATKHALIAALRQGEWHVFHFIGHGVYDAAREEGAIAFAAPGGTADFVSARQLSATLGSHPTLRLAVFNACETGQGSAADPHSSVAAAMIHGGMPAIVGMQFPITDIVAPVFSEAFYAALAEGRPVDLCMQAGRQAIWLANERSLEWGTPVLYQRSTDGRIFDLVRGPADGPTTKLPRMAPPPVTSAPTSSSTPAPSLVIASSATADVFASLNKGSALPAPTGLPAIARIPFPDMNVQALALSPDGSLLAVSAGTGAVGLIPVGTETVIPLNHEQVLPDHKVETIAFTPDGRYVCTLTDKLGMKATVAWWDTTDGSFAGSAARMRLLAVDPHSGVAYGVTMADGVVAQPGPYRGAPLVFEPRLTSGERSSIWGLTCGSRHLAFTKESADATKREIHLVDIATRRSSFFGLTHKHANDVALTCHDRFLIALDPNDPETLQVHDVHSGTGAGRFRLEGGPRSWAVSPGGLLYTGPVGSRNASLIDVTTGEQVLELGDRLFGGLARPAFSAHDRYFAASKDMHTVLVWDLYAASGVSAPSRRPVA